MRPGHYGLDLSGTPTTARRSRPSSDGPDAAARRTTTPNSASRSPRTTRGSRSTSAARADAGPSPPRGSRGRPRVRRAWLTSWTRTRRPGCTSRSPASTPCSPRRSKPTPTTWRTGRPSSPGTRWRPSGRSSSTSPRTPGDSASASSRPSQQAQEIVRSNEDWLYATDANGRRLVGAGRASSSRPRSGPGTTRISRRSGPAASPTPARSTRSRSNCSRPTWPSPTRPRPGRGPGREPAGGRRRRAAQRQPRPGRAPGPPPGRPGATEPEPRA
jgi:hypothetical protein